MNKLKPKQYRQFINGRIGKVADHLVPDEAVTDVKNMHFDTIGRATVRPGVALINSQISDTYACLGLYYFQSTSYSQLLAVFSDGANNDIYYENSGSWTKIKEDDTKALKTRFTTFLDRVIRVNGTDNATAWDGNAGSWSQYAGSAAKDLNLDDMDSYDCSLIENFKQRVYMAGNSTNSDRLFYSSIVSSTPHITWTPGDDYVDINPNDGDNITALKKTAVNLLIFKNRFIYRYRGSAGVDPEPQIFVGTPSQEAVIDAKNGIYFFSSTPAIYRYTGGSQPVEISRPVADFLEAIPSTYYATVSAYNEADGDHVCFSIGDVTVGGVSWTNVVLRYTISSQVWTVYSYGTELRRGEVYDNGTNWVTVAGDNDGNVMTLNSSNTDINSSGNAIAIEYNLTTKFYDLGLISQTALITKLTAVCEKAQGAKLFYQVNDENTWHNIGQLRKYVTIFNNQQVEGHRVRFKLAGTSKVAAAILEGFELIDLYNKGIIE